MVYFNLKLLKYYYFNIIISFVKETQLKICNSVYIFPMYLKYEITIELEEKKSLTYIL